MVAILKNQREFILEAVQAMYSDVAACPHKTFHFPTGRRACEFVGYPPPELDAIPATAVESFAGVGYPFAADVIRAGDTVLDVGAGSGTDVLIATLRVGPAGTVYGLDMTAAMSAKLTVNAAAAGASQVRVLDGNAEAIPLADASVDAVTSNGVLNLVPDKAAAFREIFRVLRPGGAVQIADIVLGRSISAKSRENPKLWAECIVGALEEAAYIEALAVAGFPAVEVLGHLDYFSASVVDETRRVADSFGARSVVLRARKPS